MTLDATQKRIAILLMLEKSDKNMEQAIQTANLGY